MSVCDTDGCVVHRAVGRVAAGRLDGRVTGWLSGWVVGCLGSWVVGRRSRREQTEIQTFE